ncbi:gp13 neck protein [Aeromonas phage 65]|uniref:Head completion, neck hetero-dimeric protein n=2 Tax=Ishigurovirus osborne TaxID=260149 RepID=A0A219YBV1_9CAUD|nr:head-tail adaptor Ad2 [Aeromonas phage 65]ADQ53103.1 gp13 neck protein [Aeromonas phage 65]APU01481.1 head completion, neck hetero-dimeric protein [Aeromonas phage 65.2]
MFNTCNNPRELKDNILRRLGAPVINVEVTETQIYDSIGRALELYKDYHHDALNRAFITIVMTEEQALTGYIDLSEYPIFAVTKILRSQVGNTTLLGGGVPLNWFTGFIMSISGAGGSCYHGPSPFGNIGSVGYFAQFSSYQKLLQDQLNPLPEYDFDTKAGILQISGKNFKKGDVLVIEVYIQNFVDLDEFAYNNFGSYTPIGSGDNATLEQKWANPYNKLPEWVVGEARNDFPDQKVYDNRWIKDMSTAFVKDIWGSILAKHQGMQLPGGVTVDGVRLIQEAKEEIEKLREELLSLSGPDAIIVG